MKTYNEIKEILSIHKKELYKKYRIKELWIFGSIARGEQKKGSDVDILVDFNKVPDLLKFIEIEQALKTIVGIEVDLVRKQALRPELKDKILSEVIKV
jgi:hypothetical protein